MISINVNSAASGAGLNLGKTNEALQKSLSRLSSGRRIVTSSDDAGGLAVSMKMAAAQKRTEATALNLANVQSILQTQDGAFTIADKVISRMSELTTLARDVTKNGGDVENYDKEFQNLQSQLISLGTEKFNGVPMFMNGDQTDPYKSVSVTGGITITVPTSEDGTQNTSVTQASLVQDPYVNMMINGFAKIDSTYIPRYPQPPTIGFDSAGNSSSLTITQAAEASIAFGISQTVTITSGTTTSSATVAVGTAAAGSFTVTVGTSGSTTYTSTQVAALRTSSASGGTLSYLNSDEFVQVVQMALQNVADMRAQNGAESSRIGFAQDLLKINAVNLEAANSRIIDVDVAAESTQLARFQILQQAGTAMLAQANTSQQSLVKLLQG